jgi:O-succinylbenzoate synthase
MIEIQSVTLREIALPMREPFRISTGAMHDRRILLLEVQDREGITAWSECVAAVEPNYSTETTDTAWVALSRWLIPRVLGHGFAEPQAVAAALERGVRGHWMAKAALEMAAWELLALRQGKPLARVLAEAAGAVEGPREKVDVGISLGLQDTVEALAERVQREVAAGYRKIKLKIKPGADVDFLSAVRAMVGDEVPLAVDANAAYTLDDLDTLKALDRFHLLMIEQPLAWDDLVDHGRLQPQMETPLCLDESITGVRPTRQMIELGAGRIVNIKPGRVAGFTASLAIHALCQERGIPVWCGGMLESGIGRAYNVALAALPGFTLPGDLSPSARYWHRDIVDPEWTMDTEGRVTVPTVPGMGVAVDAERVEALTVRREVMEV